MTEAAPEPFGTSLLERIVGSDSPQAVYRELFSALKAVVAFDSAAMLSVAPSLPVAVFQTCDADLALWAACCRRNLLSLEQLASSRTGLLLIDHSQPEFLALEHTVRETQGHESQLRYTLLASASSRLHPPRVLALGRSQLPHSFSDIDKETLMRLSSHIRLAVGFAGKEGAVAVGGGSAAPVTSRLTPREREVARLVATGYTNKEIATILQTSPHTIRNQVHSVFDKLQITTRTQLASHAVVLDF